MDDITLISEDELKKNYTDMGLAKVIAEYMQKDGLTPMHLYVTLASMIGCTIGGTCNDRKEMGALMVLTGTMCANAATTTFQKLKGEKPKDGEPTIQ